MEFLMDICLNLFCSLREGAAGLLFGISGKKITFYRNKNYY